MAVTIGSNISALGVKRALDRASSSISSTFERLSSGLRINRASDDAAGLAVSTSLTHRARILTRAGLNVSDAVAVVNIADAAMEQVSSLLTRMSELAYQAANGSYSRGQRRTLEAEFLSLDKEIRRIGSTTRFNGIDLLGGQRSSRAATTVDFGGGATSFGSPSVSADGRYIAVLDQDFNLILVDSTTGSRRTVADAATYAQISHVKVLANGDVAFLDAGFGEIFYWSQESNEIENLTANSGGGSNILLFNMSDDGSTLAFVASANFVDGSGLSARGSAHPGQQLWTYNLQEGILRRVVNSFNAFSATTSLQLSSDGSFVAANDSTFSRFIVANTTGPISVREIVGSVGIAGVTNAGEAYFRSSLNLAGSNPGLVAQIFSLNHSSNTTRQLTSVTSNGITAARMSADGSTLYVVSTLDHAGDGSTSRQLFSFDTANPGFRRLTNISGGIASQSLISGDGGRFFDLTSGNVAILDTTLDGIRVDFEVGYGALGNIADSISALTRSVRGLGAYGLSSQMLARAAIDRISTNLNQLNSSRGSLGALMSRLSSATNIINSLRDEFTAASGRIKDADVAAETANLTKQQILQQVGTAILAQAKTAPQIALQLLSI